jgi:signal transduction histidine kinase/signal recognition particle receptor subunit beta
MAQISHADKEIKLKIVYCGPALSGKTTNLIYVHQVLFPNQKVKLFSINTGDDRTLFFDLLPLDLGRVKGYDLKLQLFTVPGQVRYNQTRRAVLQKADGVVFVADSQRKEQSANRESYENMMENLAANHIDYQAIPLVVQYNKQDLDEILPSRELDALLNERKVPHFGAIAVTGVGVLQTLKNSILQVLDRFNRDFPDFPVAEIEEKIDRSFEAVLEAYQKQTRPPSAESTADAESTFRSRLQSSAHNIKVRENREDIVPGELLDKAVETNIEIAELYNELNTAKNLLEQKNRELTILGQIAQALTEPFDQEQLPRMIFKSILMTFQTGHGTLLEFNPESRQLRELYVSGFNRDPLTSLTLAPGVHAARHLFEQKKAFGYNVFSFDKAGLPGMTAEQLAESLKKLKIMAFMTVPICASGACYGLMTVYQMINESSVLKAFGPDDLKFFGRLGSSVSLAFEKMVQMKQVRQLGDQMEEKVSLRTAELEESLRILQAQNRDYVHRLAKLETLVIPVLRMSKRQDQLLQGFKGEITKPISAMMTSAKIVEKFGLANRENIDRFISVIRDESGRMNKVLGEFDLSTTRFLEKTDFVQQVFPLAGLLGPLRDVHGPVLQMKGLEWREEIPEGLPPLVGDKGKFQFVLHQLTENALQFTTSGYIEIKAQFNPIYNDRFLLVSLTDSGAGISRENLPRVFDRFFREQDDFGSEQSNYGLGLTFCKEIVEQYGGRIWAKSEEGIGSTFFVELPVQYA